MLPSSGRHVLEGKVLTTRAVDVRVSVWSVSAINRFDKCVRVVKRKRLLRAVATAVTSIRPSLCPQTQLHREALLLRAEHRRRRNCSYCIAAVFIASSVGASCGPTMALPVRPILALTRGNAQVRQERDMFRLLLVVLVCIDR